MKQQFHTSCINADGAVINKMKAEAKEITRRTFLNHVNRASLRYVEECCNYSAHHTQGLTMAGDKYIAYYKSRYEGIPCSYLVYSGIEYIFT